MKTILLSVLALIAESAKAAAPANDLFSRATPLVGRYVKLLNQTGVKSTVEALDPNLQGTKPVRTVWYRIDEGMKTSGSINHAELRITDRAGLAVGLFRQVDRDAGLGGLILVNENANTTVNDTEVFSFGVQPNEPLYLCVAANGSFDLELKLGSADCDFFGQLPVQTGATISLTRNLSIDVPPTDVGDSPPESQKAAELNHGMWVTWSPTFTGTAIMDTSFSSLASDGMTADTHMAVYTGADLASLVKVAEDDESGYQDAARVSLSVTSGVRYHLWIGTSGETLPIQKLELRCYESGAGGRIVHAAESVSALENQGVAQFRIRRMGGDAAVGATLTMSGSATVGTDYTIANTVVSFPPGSSDAAYLQTVPVQLINDTHRDDAESITYTLTSATGGASLQGSTRSIFIYDPMVEAQGAFTHDDGSPLVVNESSGRMMLPIELTRSTNQMQLFKVVPGSNSTARNGEDYELQSTSFTLGGGASRWLTLNILQDRLSEGQEHFQLIGYTQVEGGELMRTTELNIVIQDDDAVVPKAGRAAVNLQSSSVQFTVLSSGAITGRVVMATGKFSFSGRLDTHGQFITKVGPSTGIRYRLLLRQVDPLGNYEVGLVPSTQPLLQNNLISTLLTTYTTSAPCPSAGLYTVIENSGYLGNEISYAAVASLRVDTRGNSNLTGRLFDGSAFTASGFTNSDRACCVGSSLYGARGRLLAELNLPSVLQTREAGNGYLTKPGRANQTNEARSIVTSLKWNAVRYRPPARNQRLLSLWDAPAVGEVILPAPFEMDQHFTLSTANKITFVGPRDTRLTSLSFLPSIGFFSGGVRATPTSVVRSYFGIVQQLGTWENGAGGYGFVPHPVSPTWVTLGYNED